jgi:hypothetical protein
MRNKVQDLETAQAAGKFGSLIAFYSRRIGVGGGFHGVF